VSSAPYGFLRVAAAAPRLRVADPQANAAFLLGVVADARGHGVQVLVFPELCLPGYTAGDLFFNLRTLVGGCERALGTILEATRDTPMVLALGIPVLSDGQLFNAAAIVQAGHVRGVVPKSFIPGYKEFYEERWFSAARDALASEVTVCAQRAPFGVDLLFDVGGEPGLTLAAEICEDLWVPVPPSSYHAVAGATVLLNLSASNDVVGKADYRRQLVEVQSARTLSACVYAGCGVHESTTDVVFSGHLLIAELGNLLAEGPRFRRDDSLLVTDVDVERLLVERARQNSFGDTAHQIQRSYKRVALDPIPVDPVRPLARRIERHPFVPQDPATRDLRCEEVFQIQTAGLAKRLEHTGLRRPVLGVSGGLDSTLAFLVCVRTLDLLSLPRAGLLAVTLPGPGTTSLTRGNAQRLAEAFGAELREIDIRPACAQHIQDIGLDPADTCSVTYQNLQARERTQVLMDLANKEGGLVVGTGDLSELALGFCTFGGDQMAMYNVNATIPKTLVRHLVSWVAAHHAEGPARVVLESILATPVSPELVPPSPDGSVSQQTENVIGPYELHDFFLWAMLRLGAGPSKILFLARQAFCERYDEATLRRWLRVFVERFFSQQFKRSALPDGPKVGSVSLSPRGDWRMPSDASPEAWLRELQD